MSGFIATLLMFPDILAELFLWKTRSSRQHISRKRQRAKHMVAHQNFKTCWGRERAWILEAVGSFLRTVVLVPTRFLKLVVWCVRRGWLNGSAYLFQIIHSVSEYNSPDSLILYLQEEESSSCVAWWQHWVCKSSRSESGMALQAMPLNLVHPEKSCCLEKSLLWYCNQRAPFPPSVVSSLPCSRLWAHQGVLVWKTASS